MTIREDTKVPPDGRWGWIIVLGASINGMATVPIFQGFGLIFKDVFPRLGFNATDATVIMNMNLAFGMLLGLITGPLLRHFGYRKVAVVSSIIYVIGILLTAFADNFTLFMITYGVLGSLGLGVSLPSCTYALNCYFTKKRGRAMGLSMTLTGLGSILVPPITSFLISCYGYKGTIILYAGVAMHTLIGAALLQPLKWHLELVEVVDVSEAMKDDTTRKQEKLKDGQNGDNADVEENRQNSMLGLDHIQRKRKTTIGSIHHDSEVGNIYGFETPVPRQLSETAKAQSWDKGIDTTKARENREFVRSHSINPTNTNHSWWGSVKSISTINLGSSMKIFDCEVLNCETGYCSRDFKPKSLDFQQSMENESLLRKTTAETTINLATNLDQEQKLNMELDDLTLCRPKKKPILSRMLRGVYDFFDLDLLRDPIYVNIMLGMSIAIFAEMNFSVLMPFILSDIDLSTNEIATVMSVIATVDLAFRCIAPYIGEWLQQPPRMMYLFSLGLLIISRSFLFFINGFTSGVLVAVGLGIAKGIRSVYMALVVPSYVPIERLPYASGIQMVTNGIIALSAGPIIGVLRDIMGSYNPCIVLMNCVTGLTAIMWLTEMYIVRRRNLRKGQN